MAALMSRKRKAAKAFPDQEGLGTMRPASDHGRYIDFFRFSDEYEDVFVTEDGYLIYACADNLGCPWSTCSRAYACTLDEMREIANEGLCLIDELEWCRAQEQTQADVAWLYSLDRAPADIARELIAWENALAGKCDGDTYDDIMSLYEVAYDATQPGRAHFTYHMSIAS